MARRIISVGAIAALTFTMGIVTATEAGAKAAPKPKGKTACATVVGTVSGTIQLKDCVDSSGANTGGSSVPFVTLTLATGGTTTWTSGKTTTSGQPTTVATNAKKCPGYVKVKKGQTAPPEPSALKVSSVVTADTAGMKVPGKLKGAVCVAPNGQITALKPFKVS